MYFGPKRKDLSMEFEKQSIFILLIFAKKFDFGQQIRCYATEVGNFSTSKRPKTDAFSNWQKSLKFWTYILDNLSPP